MRIMVIEDDPDLSANLSRALKAGGYAVDLCMDGEEADSILRHERYDLVLLDLGLPGCSGLEVLRRLRQRRDAVPVIMLTASGGLPQRVAGLDAGADDYLAKPFDLPELEARVRALLRRSAGQGDNRLVHGRIELDRRARTVTVDGALIDLPRREMGVLEVLLSRVGEVVAKEQIAGHIFDFGDDASLASIEIYVHRLRKRLAAAGLSIRTVRSLGYYLDPPEVAAS